MNDPFLPGASDEHYIIHLWRCSMRPIWLLSGYGILALLFCVGLLSAPSFWISLYGAKPDSQAIGLLRLIGALFGGIGAMAWAGRNAEPSEARDAMILGFVVLNGLAALVALIIALSGIYNAFAWGPVICWVLCTVAFAVTMRSNRTSNVPMKSGPAVL
jgi:hypothetical protein